MSSFHFPFKIICTVVLILTNSLITFSQVIYHDIIPDTLITYSVNGTNITPGIYNLDLDQSGSTDYILTSDAWCSWSPDYIWNQWSAISGAWTAKLFTAHDYVDSLRYGDPIDESLNYKMSETYIRIDDNYNNVHEGWAYNHDYFIGLKNGDRYGWLRARIQLGIIIKDYAWQTLPNQPIFAGEGLPNYVENLAVADISDEKNGLDLHFSFDHAILESAISEYRIMAVRADQSSQFTLDSANAVTAENYYSVIPNGGPYSGTFLSNSTSTDGNLITDLVPYRIFVLSISSAGDNGNFLSPPSEEIMLKVYTDKVEILYTMDTDNLGDARDLTVTFNKIDNELKVAEYRILLVPDGSGPLTVEEANVIPPPDYYSLTPSGFDFTVVMPQTSTDINGDPIQQNIMYRAYILSVADGTITDYNNLSLPSNPVILAIPNLLCTGQRAGDNIVYIDIDPDSIVYEKDMILDLDQDTYGDFMFSGHENISPSYFWEEYKISTYNNNEYLGNPSEPGWVDKLDTLYPLAPFFTWSVGDGIFYEQHTVGDPLGLWTDYCGIKFMGFRLIKSGDTIYGWMKLKRTYCLILMEYAYMSHPNEIPQSTPVTFRIYPNPVSQKLQVTGYRLQVNGEKRIMFYDSYGREIYDMNIPNGQKMSSIDVSGWHEGLYTVIILENNEIAASRKIMIIH